MTLDQSDRLHGLVTENKVDVMVRELVCVCVCVICEIWDSDSGAAGHSGMVEIRPCAAAEGSLNPEDPNPQTENVRTKRHLRGNTLPREPVNNGTFGK
jgi:hypothetical protein